MGLEFEHIVDGAYGFSIDVVSDSALRAVLAEYYGPDHAEWIMSCSPAELHQLYADAVFEPDHEEHASVVPQDNMQGSRRNLGDPIEIMETQYCGFDPDLDVCPVAPTMNGTRLPLARVYWQQDIG